VPFNLSFTHIAVVGIVALVVLGPERLPEVAKTVGQFYREYKRIRGDLQVEVREAINEFKEPFRDQIDEFKGIVRDVKNDVSSPTVPAGPRPVPAAERRPSAPIAVPPLAGVAPSLARHRDPRRSCPTRRRGRWARLTGTEPRSGEEFDAERGQFEYGASAVEPDAIGEEPLRVEVDQLVVVDVAI
jgi:sec-independent protein translocase protein TatB